MSQRYDVAIVGGGVMGSSVAYWLLRESPGLAVAVIEPDPTYEWCSTLRASGGCRVQFTCPENIAHVAVRRSTSSSAFAADHGGRRTRGAGGLGARRYCSSCRPGHAATLERNCGLQRVEGCNVVLLRRAARGALSVDARGRSRWRRAHARRWLVRSQRPAAGLPAQSRRAGCALRDRRSRRRIALPRKYGRGTLASGERIAPAPSSTPPGAWAGEVARACRHGAAGPPMRRFEHYFTAGTPMERLPYVKDLQRLAFRSEGPGFSGGLVDGNERRGFDFDVDHDYFERVVWPAVAYRFPPLEAAKCHRTWSGLVRAVRARRQPDHRRLGGRPATTSTSSPVSRGTA